MKNFVLILTYIFSIGAFVSGCSDYVEELPNDYVYVSESPDQKFIEKINTVNLDRYVPCKVIYFDVFEEFIFAIQEYVGDCISGDFPVENVELGELFVWVIDTKKDLVYGPFDLNK